MNGEISFSPNEIVPDLKAILAYGGVPDKERAPSRVREMAESAISLFVELAAPRGIVDEISGADFASVYEGEGRNEPVTPVGEIMGKAQRLALFAVTAGQAVSDRIAACFEADDCAGGAMLDAAASAAADGLAAITERRFHDALVMEGYDAKDLGVLRYSPGYCGWHVSGQRRLFEFLRPERVGITLNDSYLMRPIKSVSGVLIAGHKEIHVFDNSYAFCENCEDEACRRRIGTVLKGLRN